MPDPAHAEGSRIARRLGDLGEKHATLSTVPTPTYLLLKGHAKGIPKQPISPSARELRLDGATIYEIYVRNVCVQHVGVST